MNSYEYGRSGHQLRLMYFGTWTQLLRATMENNCIAHIVFSSLRLWVLSQCTTQFMCVLSTHKDSPSSEMSVLARIILDPTFRCNEDTSWFGLRYTLLLNADCAVIHGTELFCSQPTMPSGSTQASLSWQHLLVNWYDGVTMCCVLSQSGKLNMFDVCFNLT